MQERLDWGSLISLPTNIGFQQVPPNKFGIPSPSVGDDIPPADSQTRLGYQLFSQFCSLNPELVLQFLISIF